MKGLQPYYKYLLIAFVFSFVSSSAVVKADVCNPPAGWYQKIQDSYDRNIRETTINHLTSSVADFLWTAVTNTEISEYMNCSSYVGQYLGPDIEADMESWGCNATDEATCQNIVNQFVYNGTYDNGKFADSKVAGSLLGMAYYLENTLEHEPVPVNMAYFFQDYGSKLPIVGDTVFAADTTDYQHLLVNSVLDLWKISRNVAYALMTIIMLYVGLTIIARKKINQQVVVNVQYAIPRIALSLILIAFSYPIGAFMASLSWSLFYSMPSIIGSLSPGGTTGALLDILPQVTVGTILSGMMGYILIAFGQGLAVSVMVVIVALVLVVLYIMVQFKALMIFIKMVLSIVSAPLEFAISAVPGSENRSVAWFKKMFSYGLGILALQATVSMVHLFGLILMGEMAAGSNAFAGFLYATFGISAIFIFGYSYAFKMPNIVETAIIGKPGGGGKR